MIDHPRLTAKELADELRVTRKTIYRWIKAGCPHANVGGSARPDYRLRLPEVEEWLITRFWINEGDTAGETG